MGNREGIDEMSSTNASVLLSVLKLIDKYDLYGQVAYPKHHKQSDVPDIYRLAAKTKVLMCSQRINIRYIFSLVLFTMFIYSQYSLLVSELCSFLHIQLQNSYIHCT